MRKLIETLESDKELTALKEEYEQLTGKFAPPYHWDCFNGIDAYKESIRKDIEDYKKHFAD